MDLILSAVQQIIDWSSDGNFLFGPVSKDANKEWFTPIIGMKDDHLFVVPFPLADDGDMAAACCRAMLAEMFETHQTKPGVTVFDDAIQMMQAAKALWPVAFMALPNDYPELAPTRTLN